MLSTPENLTCNCINIQVSSLVVNCIIYNTIYKYILFPNITHVYLFVNHFDWLMFFFFFFNLIFWLNYRIEGHLFTSYWITIVPIVFCFVLQKVLTHVKQVVLSGPAFCSCSNMPNIPVLNLSCSWESLLDKGSYWNKTACWTQGEISPHSIMKSKACLWWQKMHGVPQRAPENVISLTNNFFINNQASAHLISVASLAGPISERVVKPVALQKWKHDYSYM